ncbi:MAG: beta-propeller domain-containing protein [Candidatus Sumerlaeia bacterium]
MMKQARFIVYATVFFLCIALAARASGEEILHMNTLGGLCRAMQIDGNYCYVAEGNHVDVVDISDRARLQTVLTIDNLPCSEFFLLDDRLYMLSDSAIEIYDVSNPTSPARLGDIPGGAAGGILVEGDYAYVSRSNTIEIYNVSNPASAILAGEVTIGERDLGTLAKKYDVLYAGQTLSGVQLVDVADPEDPYGLGTIHDLGYVYRVRRSGNYLYVAAGSGGVAVIDISIASTPVKKGNCASGDAALDLVVDGDYAFVADRYSGITTVDVRNPSAPTLQASTGSFSGYRLALSGDVLLAGLNGMGFGAYNIEDPLALDLLDLDAISGSYVYSIVDGNVLYACNERSLLSLDISNPAVPHLMDEVITPWKNTHILLDTPYIYVANGAGGLIVVDVSDPSDMVVISTYHFESFEPERLSKKGDILFCTDPPYDGVRVIDVSNPLAPESLKKLIPPQHTNMAQVYENVLFVGSLNMGIFMHNISNPENPSLISLLGGVHWATEMDFENGFGYVASGSYGLKILDVNNPESPLVVGTSTEVSNADGVTVSGNMAFVANSSDGLAILDVSNSSSPILLYEQALDDGCMHTTLHGLYAYVSGGDGGLHIVQVPSDRQDLLNYLLGRRNAMPENADYNSDGKVDGADLIWLQHNQ